MLPLLILLGCAGRAAAPAAPPVPSRLHLEPGQRAAGVLREEPLALSAPNTADCPALAVDGEGRTWVAMVALEQEGRERLLLRVAPAGGDFGAPVEAWEGERAWAPRLAPDPRGGVWLAWEGRIEAGGREELDRAVYLRHWEAPGRPGPLVEASAGASAGEGWSRAAEPALAVDEEGRVHLAWEQADRRGSTIAYRAFSPEGRPLGPVERVSGGWLDRHPAIALWDGRPAVAWDRLVTPAPGDDPLHARPVDPDYDLLLAVRGGGGWELARVDGRPGVQAAPSLAATPGGLLVAYHSSHLHGLVKWWTLRRLAGRPGDWRLEELAAPNAAALEEPAGEVQGAEFPALLPGPGGALWLLARSSQGALLQRVDAEGISPALELQRSGWGSRGTWAFLAWGPGGELLGLRRARKTVLLERFQVEPGAGAPAFRPVEPAKSLPSEALPRPSRGHRAPEAPTGFGPGVLLLGDLHTHSVLTDATGSPDEVYARAWSRGLDFCALTDHDAIVGTRLSPSEHEEMAWLTEVFDGLPGFATLHAYEWTTPPTPRGSGHENAYFRGFAPTPVYGYRQGYPDLLALLGALRPEQAWTAPHHASWTGTDWEHADPAVQRAFELASVHGVTEYPGNRPIPPRGDRPEGFASVGLQRGLVFGFVGGSDGHGLLWHHGIARRRDPWVQGATGVLAVRADERGALWDALYARRSWATTGAPLVVLARAVDGERVVPQGGEARVRRVELRYLVRGDRELARLELVRDGEAVAELPVQGTEASGSWVDPAPPPGRHAYYLRAEELPAGREGEGVAPDLGWSSPLFLTVED